MSAIPVDVDTDASPPTTVPLYHFVVALCFLVAGVAVGWARGRQGHLAQVHLLLAGWVCLTILGAMTQFVPVWAGVALHSRRLATVQLPLAATGFAGLAAAFLLGRPVVLPVAGLVALTGIWVFVYNVGRTLTAAKHDVTTRHFTVALGWFVVLTVAGVALALDHATGLLADVGLARTRLSMAHATVAVFGAVLTTIAGALAQLAPMFTQTDATRLSRSLRRLETPGYHVGVALLAAGRLVGSAPLARVGGLLVVVGLGAVGVLLADRLRRMRVQRTPMLRRYAVAAVALLAWVPITVFAWLRDPLAYAALFGHRGAGALLLVGVVGFVVVGTLYHVVPFIVWTDRYSDRLGFESVPGIEDLYDHRVAAVDGVAFALAGGLAVGHEAGVAPTGALLAAGVLGFGGAVLVGANLVGVIAVHGPRSLQSLLGVSHPGDRSDQ